MADGPLQSVVNLDGSTIVTAIPVPETSWASASLLSLARSGQVPSVKLGARQIFHVPMVRDVLRDAMDRGRGI